MRPMIIFIQTSFSGRELVGAEIGVYRGDNALDILRNLSIKKLYLIDPYKKYRGYNQSEYYDQLQPQSSTLKLYIQNQKAFDEDFIYAKDKFKKYNNIKFIRKKSEEAVSLILDNSLDFVYIDGNHRYRYVKKDIDLYYPKIKSGGVLGGHNYESCLMDVIRAVDIFVKKKKLKLFTALADWWFMHP